MIYVTSSKCKLKTLAVLKPKTEDYWAVLDCNTLKRSSSQPRWQSDWAETVFTVKVFKMMVGFWCCLVAWQDQMTVRYTITLARKGKCTAGPECCFRPLMKVLLQRGWRIWDNILDVESCVCKLPAQSSDNQQEWSLRTGSRSTRQLFNAVHFLAFTSNWMLVFISAYGSTISTQTFSKVQLISVFFIMSTRQRLQTNAGKWD